MKIKSLLLLTMLLIGVVACDELSDATTFKINTKLDVEVPVESSGQVSVALKSTYVTNDSYSFNGEKDFSLADNPDLSASVTKIKNLVLSGGSIQVSQLGAPNEITTMTIKVFLGSTEVGSLVKENLNSSNVSLTNADIIQLISLQTQLTNAPAETYTFKITGTANYEVNTTVKLVFNSDVEASLI